MKFSYPTFREMLEGKTIINDMFNYCAVILARYNDFSFSLLFFSRCVQRSDLPEILEGISAVDSLLLLHSFK